MPVPDPDCARCNGEGWYVVTVMRVGVGIEADERGRPVPVPVPEPEPEQRLCSCLNDNHPKETP